MLATHNNINIIINANKNVIYIIIINYTKYFYNKHWTYENINANANDDNNKEYFF